MRRARALGRLLRTGTLVLAVALAAAGCETTVPHATALLERSGTGTTTLPTFTAKGAYDIAYTFDACTGGVTGITLDAVSGKGTTPVRLLQTASVSGSGNTAGQATGPVTLTITTHCHWTLTVTG